MITRNLVVLVFTLFIATACASDALSMLLRDRHAHDGEIVRATGTLRNVNGLFNLYTSHRQECLGLLFTDADRERYRTWDGRRVTVSGLMQAEGCGREGVCDGRLCGPAILRRVVVETVGGN